MKVIVTQRHYDGSPQNAESSDGRFSWFAGQDGYINDKQAGRSVYQMSYMGKKMGESDPLPADVAQMVLEFWAGLRAAQKEAEDARMKRDIEEIEATPRISDAERAARRKAEKEFDNLFNEGAEGFNPYRDLS